MPWHRRRSKSEDVGQMGPKAGSEPVVWVNFLRASLQLIDTHQRCAAIGLTPDGPPANREFWVSFWPSAFLKLKIPCCPAD